jgi:hypothetical protein
VYRIRKSWPIFSIVVYPLPLKYLELPLGASIKSNAN